MLKDGTKIKFVYTDRIWDDWKPNGIYTLIGLSTGMFSTKEKNSNWPLWSIKGQVKPTGETREFWEVVDTKPKRNLPPWF